MVAQSASAGRGAVGVTESGLDVFGRKRVSLSHLIFDSQLEYHQQPFFWNTVTANGGSVVHRPNDSSLDLKVTGTVGSRVIRQTREYFPYRPGHAQSLKMTFAFGNHADGSRRRVGLFDDNDGVYFERDHDGTLMFVIRKNGNVFRRSKQADWNKDKFNGKGPSKVLLNHTKTQILVMDLQWLGVGRVRFGFDIDDQSYEAHEFRNANKFDSTYMRTANLPIRYEIESTSSSPPASMQQICCSLQSEGGQLTHGVPFSADNGATLRTIDDPLPVLSIRPKLTFSGRPNHTFILPTFVRPYAAVAAYWKLLFDPTELTGANWQSRGDNSSMEYDVSATAVTGGEQINSGYIPAGDLGGQRTLPAISDSVIGQLPMAISYDGTSSTILTLVLDGLSNGSGGGAIGWREIR